VKGDKAFYPLDIGAFCVKSIMMKSQRRPDLGQELWAVFRSAMNLTFHRNLSGFGGDSYRNDASNATPENYAQYQLIRANRHENQWLNGCLLDAFGVGEKRFFSERKVY